MAKCGKVEQICNFAINYSTNERLHLFLIRRHIIAEDLVGDEVVSSQADLVFEVMYMTSVTYLSDTCYQVRKKHREYIYT